MREIKLYICEICGTEYNEKSKACECEKCHCAPAEIKQARYLPKNQNHGGYPVSIDVRMADGKILTYKR